MQKAKFLICTQKVLIVPLWNWNIIKLFRIWWIKAVLIVPLWNWNPVGTSTFFQGLSFNRTFMELKYSRRASIRGRQRSFNRTFMELKLVWTGRIAPRLDVLIVPLWNWNICRRSKSLKYSQVLIVPLWNWNFIKKDGMIVARDSFNRTFMELKSI